MLLSIHYPLYKHVWGDTDGFCRVRQYTPVHWYIFCYPFYYLGTFLCPGLSLIRDTTQTRGYSAGSSLSSPLRYAPPFLSRQHSLQLCLPSPTRLESRLPTLLGVLSSLFLRLLFLKKLCSKVQPPWDLDAWTNPINSSIPGKPQSTIHHRGDRRQCTNTSRKRRVSWRHVW